MLREGHVMNITMAMAMTISSTPVRTHDTLDLVWSINRPHSLSLSLSRSHSPLPSLSPACVSRSRSPSLPVADRQAMGKLDRANADVEASERLASFLGTLFVKHEITETDEKVLAAAAKRRPKLKGETTVLLHMRVSGSSRPLIIDWGHICTIAVTMSCLAHLRPVDVACDRVSTVRFCSPPANTAVPPTNVVALCVQTVMERCTSPFFPGVGSALRRRMLRHCALSFAWLAWLDLAWLACCAPFDSGEWDNGTTVVSRTSDDLILILFDSI